MSTGIDIACDNPLADRELGGQILVRARLHECDYRRLAPVIRLVAVGRATVAEIFQLLGVGVLEHALDFGNAGRLHAARDVGRKIEGVVPGAMRILEVHAIVRVIGDKSIAKLAPDLVGHLLNAGTDARDETRGGSTQCTHGLDRGLDDTAERAFPTCVSGSDDAAAGFGKQHRDAVGGQHAEGDSRARRDQSVGARMTARRQRPLEGEHLGAVNLRKGIEPNAGEAERAHDARPILAYLGRLIAGSRSAVERRVDTLRNAAGSSEEAVTHAALPAENMAFQALHARIMA